MFLLFSLLFSYVTVKTRHVFSLFVFFSYVAVKTRDVFLVLIHKHPHERRRETDSLGRLNVTWLYIDT